MNSLLFVNWNPDKVLFNIGSFELRYYSLLFGLGLVLAYFVVRAVFKDRKIPLEHMDRLFVYSFFGILIGARLGHCLFYQWEEYYSSHLLEIILPFRITDQGWQFTGYEGLASHGGTAGIIIALFFFVRKTKMNLIDVMDYVAVGTPIAACCIRLANLMNSEIVGKVTDVPWAFYFQNYEGPRHPAQLYEAIAYFIFFLVNIYMYRKYYRNERLHRGFMFGLTIFLIFLFRFFIEFVKEDQVEFESTMMLNMGQWLSVPFIIVGFLFMKGGKWLDALCAKLDFKDKKIKK